LDITIDKCSRYFSTSLYRKPSFTGLSTKFSSAISNSYRYNLILCLLDQAYKLCSTYLNFTNQIENILVKMGTPSIWLQKASKLNLILYHVLTTGHEIAQNK